MVTCVKTRGRKLVGYRSLAVARPLSASEAMGGDGNEYTDFGGVLVNVKLINRFVEFEDELQATCTANVCWRGNLKAR